MHTEFGPFLDKQQYNNDSVVFISMLTLKWKSFISSQVLLLCIVLSLATRFCLEETSKFYWFSSLWSLEDGYDWNQEKNLSLGFLSPYISQSN